MLKIQHSRIKSRQKFSLTWGNGVLQWHCQQGKALDVVPCQVNPLFSPCGRAEKSSIMRARSIRIGNNRVFYGKGESIVKKYVITQVIGTWEKVNGVTVVNGTVVDELFVTDTNDYNDAWSLYTGDTCKTRYDSNGIWRMYRFYSNRNRAKKALEYYARKNGKA